MELYTAVTLNSSELEVIVSTVKKSKIKEMVD
jgi:hypothetical protein